MSRLSAKIELNNKLSIFFKKDYEINKKDGIIFLVILYKPAQSIQKNTKFANLNKNNFTFCLTYFAGQQKNHLSC